MGLDHLLQSGAANPQLYEEMYHRYTQDPSSVDRSWRHLFEKMDEQLTPPLLPTPRKIEPAQQNEPYDLYATTTNISNQIRIYNLIYAYRSYGHLLANINPIRTKEVPIPHQLQLANLGFHESELEEPFPTCGIAQDETLQLKDIITILQEIYCGNIGIEYMNRDSRDLELWLQNQIEPNRCKIQLSIDEKHLILQHLNKSSLFEWFLQTKYVGQKRFSLEGGETLIPIFAAIIEKGASLGMNEFVVGMAHRGRLNVLCNILDKSYSTIFSEFEDHFIPGSFEGSGDVKYHKGFTSEIMTSKGKKVIIDLAPNPSHLEAVNGVVEGEVRAKQTILKDIQEQEKVVPILVHGDAAIAGQGTVYEVMQMNNLSGYGTGGTIHIVINNQIGFTTIPEDSRSTIYSTDISRAFGAPVFHVNAEDPESCIYATNLAIEMRQRFHCDVFIDLNCYRKYGHNETDEPAFTQPIEYQLIRQKKSIREIYRDQLLHEGVLEKMLAEKLEKEFKNGLQQALKKIKEIEIPTQKLAKHSHVTDKSIFEPVDTSVPLDELKKISDAISLIPEGFTIHRKLKQLVENRQKMFSEPSLENPVDWGMSELMAYGTLLDEGTHVRLAGQDSCRGTFSHRHAIWMDQKKEKAYFPLQHVAKDQGRCDIINSPLSEQGVLAFEYGYSVAYPNALVIWEAQFGDFCNGAQVIIDQFLVPGEQKWGQKANLVLFLPHGYEGQGPEHSSARMERFLTLCGDDNIIVANPSEPAQNFHLLRRHIIKKIKKPLIVFTPKGLLRLPECTNPVEDFVNGSFQEIIDDPDPPKNPTRLLFCNGRIYYDLIREREKTKTDDLAIIRIEQLYPLDVDQLKNKIQRYHDIEKWIWAQEEPRNMGAWNYIRPRLHDLIPKNVSLEYAGRDRSASPATGSLRRHNQELKEILKTIFPKLEPLHVDVNLEQRV